MASGKGTWGHVYKVMQGYKTVDGLNMDWDKIIIITSDFFKDKIEKNAKSEIIVVDTNKPLKELTQDIQNKIKTKIKGLEVAINLISGTGKEHMAILSALLKLGVGLRLVALTKTGIEEV
jgi:hypothetical protein